MTKISPRGAVVAIAGLVALALIVVIGYTELPEGANKGGQVVALSSAGFGVIGAIVGAYFGVNASQAAATNAQQQLKDNLTDAATGGRGS